MRSLPRNTILAGDAVEQLRRLPSASVDCAITSPPYYQLRDYGVEGQLGLEPTVSAWVDGLATVMRELARVLKPTGSLWLNLADGYSRHPRYGAAAKSQLLAPERLLIALADDGWIVRNKVIWAKTNPMPTSVVDRLNTTYEVVYFLTRSRRYFFDLDAIRQPHRTTKARRARPIESRVPDWAGPLAAGSQSGLLRARPAGQPGHRLGKNPGDVWPLATAGYRGAHFATFPRGLVERPLLATCPERICVRCGRPGRGKYVPQLIEGRVDCLLCNAPTQAGVVLDPFFGTGTVGAVAEEHRRDWVGIELNALFRRLAERRIGHKQAESSASQRHRGRGSGKVVDRLQQA